MENLDATNRFVETEFNMLCSMMLSSCSHILTAWYAQIKKIVAAILTM